MFWLLKPTLRAFPGGSRKCCLRGRAMSCSSWTIASIKCRTLSHSFWLPPPQLAGNPPEAENKLLTSISEEIPTNISASVLYEVLQCFKPGASSARQRACVGGEGNKKVMQSLAPPQARHRCSSGHWARSARTTATSRWTATSTRRTASSRARLRSMAQEVHPKDNLVDCSGRF